MRSWLRWTVTVVLSLDALVALAFLGSEVLETKASTSAPAEVAAKTPPAAPAPSGVAGTVAAPAAAASIPAAPSAPAAAAANRPATADTEAAPLDPPAEADPAPQDTIPGAAEDEADGAQPVRNPAASKSDAFQRLLRAYENMEPESAAKALSELASRDRRAVVELVLNSKPRTSGAMLDALTQTSPALAADLSYEIWRRAESEAQNSPANAIPPARAPSR